MKIIRLDNQLKQKLIGEYKTSLEKEANEKLAKFAAQCEEILPSQKAHAATEKLKIYYTAVAFAMFSFILRKHLAHISKLILPDMVCGKVTLTKYPMKLMPICLDRGILM